MPRKSHAPHMSGRSRRPYRSHRCRRSQVPHVSQRHRDEGGAAANTPRSEIRVAPEVPKLESGALADSGVFEKNAHLVYRRDGARTAPAPPISMFTVTRRPRFTKLGVFFETTRTPLGRTPRTLKLGPGGWARFNPHYRWAFFSKTTVPLNGLLGTLTVGVRGTVHIQRFSDWWQSHT